MFSSEDEQDDRGIFDQLKSIKPFTVDQLYLLHPDVGCPPKAALSSGDDNINDDDNKQDLTQLDRETYQHLVEHERYRKQLVEVKHNIKKLYKKTCQNIDNAWTFKEESIRKIAMCQQGKIAETTLKYKQAHIDNKYLDKFSHGFSELIEMMTKEYIYYSFESQTKRNKIATHLSISYQMPNLEQRKAKLKSAITTLIEFIRYLGDIKSDFVIQCRKWLRALAKRLLEEGSTENYRFIISQLAKGPVGTADWSADLIECKPYEQVSGFNSYPQYITHCSAILSELFYNLQSRIKYVNVTTSIRNRRDGADDDGDAEDVDDDDTKSSSVGKYRDQNWSLVDPRFNCTEELNICSSSNNILPESDIIKFCLRIPVAQIFRAYVKKCLDTSSEFHIETDKNYEYIMLKLLTIGTIIIKTYQIGLETFNSIQYGNLIEYLSSQIRRTVIILSDQWAEFKRRLRGIDDALLMRLQVEYDSFMLRSILVILELRESGIWRHLSRVEQEGGGESRDNLHGWAADGLRPAFTKLLQATGISATQYASPTVGTPKTQITELNPSQKEAAKSYKSTSSSLTYEFSVEWFKEVSESMLWHILWQFHHNGFVSSCDYHSDNYWLERFQEKSVIYLFVNKIRDSPPGECSYLVNSITSMLLSRTRPDSKLVNYIAAEIFDLTFKHQSVKHKVTKKGLRSLIRCAEKFPNLISLYIQLMGQEEQLEDTAVELIKGCSLTGWLCNVDEFGLLETWLIEYPLSAAQNKVARLIISKILLNSPPNRFADSSQNGTDCNDAANASAATIELNCSVIIKGNKSRKPKHMRDYCVVDLNLRRKLALLLYEASFRHAPENTEIGSQSLGASVEVAFGTGLYCEQAESNLNTLVELSVDANYQQFYVWTWRVLFLLQLHILNQAETDWNDVQSRSGTSRSTKNTVLISDPFHPVPSIEDSECSQLAEGLRNQTPIASFIYLLLTDATWRVDNLDACVVNLNILANSGHITPSLMAMKFLTICHLNDLADVLMKDKKCIDYFTTIILSNFDAARLASLIATQLDHLKQYRQLQLSYFYIGVLLEVNQRIAKQVASSWFSSEGVSFEKVACVLDYIVRFNFATQRFEIVRKFYDCAYIIHDDPNQTGHTNSWLGTFLTSNPSQRELSTNLHLLAQKFRKFTWLQWVTTECDSLRLEKTWEDIVVYLSSNEEANLDSAIKKVCPNSNASSLKSMLPIYSWIRQIFDIMESDLNHPLCPLIWYNFFLNYFANSLNGVSVGFKLVPQATVTKLLIRLDSLYNYHLYKQRNWSTTSLLQQNSLTELYRAYKFWLQDPSLRDAYIDIDRLREEYQVSLLKAVMESSNASVCLRYIDLQSIETQNRSLMQIWLTSTNLALCKSGTEDDSIVCFDDQSKKSSDSSNDLGQDDFMANDAISLIAGSYGSTQNSEILNIRSTDNAQEELCRPLSEDYFGKQKYQTTDELMDVVKKNFLQVFEESTLFGLNVNELDRTTNELIDLVKQLYTNERREFVRAVPCVEGNECAGPARIKFEADEAQIDERKSQCIQDRRRQCQELVTEILSMPKNRTVLSTIIIEETLRRLINDPDKTKLVIESLLDWISEPANHNQLNGSYYTANHLLKTSLEILSTTDQVDAFNYKLFEVCLAHPESIQIFSPYLTPSACSNRVFLDLYKTICSMQTVLGSNATFVLLSKFDLNAFLNTNPKCWQSHHQLITTTCLAFKNIGKNPEELTLDLFKRHLQVELASPDRRKSEELLLVLNLFLQAMDEQVLSPDLWLFYLSIIGLERNSNKTKVNHLNAGKSNSRRDSSNQTSYATAAVAPPPATTTLSATLDDSIGAVVRAIPNQHLPDHNASLGWVAEDVSHLADCQSVFDYHSLDKLIKAICGLMKQRHTSSSVTLSEFYKDYLEQYGMVMLSVAFMWLKSVSELYPDNHDLIWKQFMDLWYDWVFLTKNCQNVSKSNYSLMVNYFVMSLQYMIHRIPESTEAILRSLLADLSNYIVQTREIVYLELTILQRCLKNLPWSSMLATPGDIGHLAIISEQENYNVFDLVSHILLEMNTKESLTMIQKFDPASMPRVAERLATAIIYHSTHLKGYKLHGSFFSSIATDEIPKLTNLILSRIEFINLEHSHNNKLLIKLLKCICIDIPNHGTPSEPGAPQHPTEPTIEKRFDRAVIYAIFISNYLVDIIKRHPIVANCNKNYLSSLVNSSMQDLEPLLTSSELNGSQKTTLYASLLKCCDCAVLENNSRMLLARSAIESNLLTSKPHLVIDLVQALGQFMTDSKILVSMVEACADLSRNSNIPQQLQYDSVSTSFCLSSVSEESYLNTCIQERAPVALLVYFESLFYLNRTVSSYGLSSPAANGNQQRSEPQLGNKHIWSSLFLWLSKLNQSLSSDLKGSDCSEASKLIFVWIRVLMSLESQLGHYLVISVDKRADGVAEGASKTIHHPEQEGSDDASSEIEQAKAGVVASDDFKSSKPKAGNSQSAAQSKITAACITGDHNSLLTFIKQLISFYDSINTGGLWSYLKSSNRSEHTSRVSVAALAVAFFITDRALVCINGLAEELPPYLSALREELAKVRRISQGKLETARKSKNLLDSAQFIESLIGSAQHSDKVQYSEVVELIRAYASID